MASERLVALVGLLAVGALGCGDRGRPAELEGGEPAAAWSATEEAERAEAVAHQLFHREDVTEAGPGRALFHVLVPVQATGPQLHRTMTEFLQGEADRDAALVAIRAIAYVSRPTADREASLFPVMWAEWVPPEGWADAGPVRSRAPYRVFTYQGVPPEW